MEAQPSHAGILTVPEVAQELRCSKAHVHNLIHGKVRGVAPLPSLWLGRRRLIVRASFEAVAEASEQALRNNAMIRSHLDDRHRRTERTNVHRQRHQKGSLQVRQHGKRKMWVLLYRDGSTRKYATLGLYSKMSKSQAEEKRDELHERSERPQLPSRLIPTSPSGIFSKASRCRFCGRSGSGQPPQPRKTASRHHLKTEFGERSFRL